MKAARIHGQHQLTIEDIPDPTPKQDELLLTVAYVGICGSDLHYYNHGAVGDFQIREPLIPGHELSGTLPDGRAATIHPATFGTPDSRIARCPHLWPGGAYLGSASTWPHTQGAMSTQLLVRRDQVRMLPAGLSLKRAALAEPLAVGLHAIAQAGGVKDLDVVVTGAGPIGQLAAAGAVALGARSVLLTDVLPGPLERAAALPGVTTQNTTETPLKPESADVVLECSGAAPALSGALVAARRRGTVVQVGMLPGQPIGVTLSPLVAKELSLKGTFRFYEEIDQAIALLAAENYFDAVITHEFDLDQVHDAFRVAADPAVSGKVLVRLDPQAGKPL